MTSEHPSRLPARLWPVTWIIVFVGLALALLWAWPEMQRQQRYLRSAAVLLLAGFIFVLWLLFFSRLRWKARFGGLAFIGLALTAAALSFEIRGVNGDLLPIIEPRWKPRRQLAAAPVPSTNQISRSSLVLARSNVPGNFPQFYGPTRDAVLPGPELERDWQAYPPKLLWKCSVGSSWGGFAVQDGLAVTLEQRGESEYIIAYDVRSGSTIWTHAYPAKYSATIAGEGPRTTPTISSNRVFTFGATGILNCLELLTGRLVWTRNTATENQASLPEWGFAGSPLVIDGKVIVSVGGANFRAMAAYSAHDGQLLWAKGEGGADYSSPIEATLLGTRQIVLFAGSLIGRNLDGDTLWAYPWRGGHPHITPPLLVSSNRVFVSSGYGTGCELVRIDRTEEGKWNAVREWKSMALKSKFGPLFRVGEYVYGLDDGIFCCVDLKNGQRRWKDGRYGHGQGLLVGGTILLTAEKGEIVLIQPNPEMLVELASLKVFNDKTWNPPALAGGYLLLRNDKEAACLELTTLKKELEKI